VRRRDAAGEIGAARLSALSVLVYGGATTLGDLAAAEQVSPPTMTRIVTGLEEAGLAARGADPDDGRVTRIRATAKGEKALEEARERRLSLLTALLDPLEEREAALLDEASEIIERIARRA